MQKLNRNTAKLTLERPVKIVQFKTGGTYAGYYRF